jgi:hypothetical protein
MQKAAAEAVFEEGEDVSSDEEDDAPAPAPAPPPAENPDDLLAGFFGDLAEAEDELKGDHKSEDKKKKLALYEPKTPQLQIDRLMAKHHQWRNLDPFMVLELSDDLDCDVDDIKNRFVCACQCVGVVLCGSGCCSSRFPVSTHNSKRRNNLATHTIKQY